MKLSVDEIKFVEGLYPRDSFDNETVNRYRLNIDNLPPILVNMEHLLIDGYHRVLAHRVEGKEEIDVEVKDIPKEKILWFATKINSTHGKQLDIAEKRSLTRTFYKEGQVEREIAEALSVSVGKVSEWLTDLVQEAKEEQKRQIIDLYLQCLTQTEIASKVDLSRQRVNQIANNFKSEIISNPPVPDSLQFFNVWNFPKRDTKYGISCKGNIPGQIVENLLYYWTEPFDTVVDPMAGGGTTIDVCKAMCRRYRAYDIDPLRDDIKKHDIREGFPKECKGTNLVFLDPPYFDMVFGELFKSSKEFYEFIKVTAKGSRKVLKKGGIVALLMCDRTKGEFECLSSECYNIFKKLRFKCIARISAPLSTESANAGEVEKAKELKKTLGRDRVLYVFKKV